MKILLALLLLTVVLAGGGFYRSPRLSVRPGKNYRFDFTCGGVDPRSGRYGFYRNNFNYRFIKAPTFLRASGPVLSGLIPLTAAQTYPITVQYTSVDRRISDTETFLLEVQRAQTANTQRIVNNANAQAAKMNQWAADFSRKMENQAADLSRRLQNQAAQFNARMEANAAQLAANNAKIVNYFSGQFDRVRYDLQRADNSYTILCPVIPAKQIVYTQLVIPQYTDYSQMSSGSLTRLAPLTTATTSSVSAPVTQSSTTTISSSDSGTSSSSSSSGSSSQSGFETTSQSSGLDSGYDTSGSESSSSQSSSSYETSSSSGDVSTGGMSGDISVGASLHSLGNKKCVGRCM